MDRACPQVFPRVQRPCGFVRANQPRTEQRHSLRRARNLAKSPPMPPDPARAGSWFAASSPQPTRSHAWMACNRTLERRLCSQITRGNAPRSASAARLAKPISGCGPGDLAESCGARIGRRRHAGASQAQQAPTGSCCATPHTGGQHGSFSSSPSHLHLQRGIQVSSNHETAWMALGRFCLMTREGGVSVTVGFTLVIGLGLRTQSAGITGIGIPPGLEKQDAGRQLHPRLSSPPRSPTFESGIYRSIGAPSNLP